MQLVLRALVALSALVLLSLGAGFLLMPDVPMAPLGLSAESAVGINFLRGDAGASLLLVGGLVARAALAGDGNKLVIPIIWVLLLLGGRILGMVLDEGGVAAAPLFATDFGLLLVLLLGRWKMRSAV
ncbi:hypothetical protein [Maricaulis sp.]|uniref:hypothetical protein n=1 Tax=Maricaulis sp. TaxID=1486257 RepID=UPI003A8E943F